MLPLFLLGALGLHLVADSGAVGGSPIEIDSCSYVHNHDESKYGFRVTFVNTSQVTAVRVRFHTWWRNLGEDQYLRDVGSFATDTSITHTFAAPAVYASGFNCAVDSAKFADGTEWNAPLEQQ